MDVVNENSVPECVICQDILYQPVTLPCGHSFCRTCVTASLKIKPLCPSCRNPMIGNPANLSTNFTIQHILETQYKGQYELKKQLAENKLKIENEVERISHRVHSLSQETKTFENILLLRQQHLKYLFPFSTTIVDIVFQGELEKLLHQCPDKRVIIQLAKQNDQNIASLCSIRNIITTDQNVQRTILKCEVQVISRVHIEEIKEIQINTDEFQQNEGHSLLNNNESPLTHLNERNTFQNGFTFQVAQGTFIENSQVSQETLTRVTENAEILTNRIIKIIENNGGINMTTIQLGQILQKQNLVQYIERGYLNSVERIHEFCWIVSGLFNFSLVEKERLWNTNCLVERILLLNGFLLKFNDIKNVTTIFDIDAPGHSVNSNVYVFAALFVILLLKYLDLI